MFKVTCDQPEKKAGIQRRVQVGMCVQQRFKSVYASTRSDQSLSFVPKKTLDPWLPIECLLKTDQTVY